MEKVNNNIDKLLWDKYIFFFKHKRNKVFIGRDLLAKIRSRGQSRFMEGCCVAIRSKRYGKVSTSMVLRRRTYGIVFFVDFPLYLSGGLNFEIKKFSYSRRISCSRLSYARFMG